MVYNSDCTIYHRSSCPSDGHDEWEKIYVPKCWWNLQNKAIVNSGGLEGNSVLTVRIEDMSVKVNIGDYIVKGECLIDMTTVRDLKGIEHFKVNLSNCNDFGDVPHIKVVAI